MDAQRQAEELIDRCVALAIYYQHFGQTRPDMAAKKAEFKEVADDARKSGLRLESITPGVLVQLYYRYERDMAIRLHDEIEEAFEFVAEIV
jgi:hypothetical protein